jgi:hypothetical protein
MCAQSAEMFWLADPECRCGQWSSSSRPIIALRSAQIGHAHGKKIRCVPAPDLNSLPRINHQETGNAPKHRVVLMHKLLIPIVAAASLASNPCSSQADDVAQAKLSKPRELITVSSWLMEVGGPLLNQRKQVQPLETRAEVADRRGRRSKIRHLDHSALSTRCNCCRSPLARARRCVRLNTCDQQPRSLLHCTYLTGHYQPRQ